MAGLGWRAAYEAMRPKRRKCERCGLYYRGSLEQCRWCGYLDERGLSQLKARIEAGHQSNKSLGQMFLVVALVILVLAVLV